MNLVQRLCVASGLVGIAFMAICPPWTENFKNSSIVKRTPAGYASIFSPPHSTNSRVYYTIDVVKLAVQSVAVLSVTVALIVLQPAFRTESIPPGLSRLRIPRKLIETALRGAVMAVAVLLVLLAMVVSKEFFPPSVLAGAVRGVVLFFFLAIAWKSSRGIGGTKE